MACCVHSSTASTTTNTTSTSTSTSSDGTRNVNWVEYKVGEAREVQWGRLKPGELDVQCPIVLQSGGGDAADRDCEDGCHLADGQGSDLVAFGRQRELGKARNLRLVRFLPCT